MRNTSILVPILTIVGLVGLLLLVAVAVLGSGSTASTVSADNGLPNRVTKFTDGDTTCYLYVSYRAGGISCLK